jgi:hypothetical protein
MINELSTFIDNEFESITIEILVNRKKILLSNYYKPPQVTNDNFFVNLNNLLNSLSFRNTDTYVFSDTNINLLKLPNNNPAKEYLEIVHSSGFLQLVCKATRILDNSYSLIDHILCNNFNSDLLMGTILTDLSDHFMNFLTIPLAYGSNDSKTPNKPTRTFTLPSMTSFKNDLSALTWNDVTSLNDVDASFDTFWDNFSTLYELHFPLKKQNFNKNTCRINEFMTTGLLISRTNKYDLHKKSIIEPQLYLERYRNYRNLYNTLIRLSKKLYYDSKFVQYSNNPKKIWSLLNDLTGNKKTSTNRVISHVVADGKNISSPPRNSKCFQFLLCQSWSKHL